ncbi:MAG: methyltransferase domain-containing protein [Deltaproteobacteria bacterium]|nr:methyltransferase domain-containing protein [Deltaproteobacteria bacterium]
MDYKALFSRLEFLRCVSCLKGPIIPETTETPQTLICKNCGATFPVHDNGIKMLLSADMSETKKSIKKFWGDLCKQWYTEIDKDLTSESLYNYLDDLKEMFRYRKHLATTEMDIDSLEGSQVLEIGSGGGAHSALFKRYGAHMTSVDITPERVISSSKKMSLIKEGTGISLQTDAENLPFVDDSFDIVYSSGVLHHSENTERCIQEVYRVLKNDGKAILMLYSRNSAMYWLNLFPKTILHGLIFKYSEAERLGLITEGRPKFGDTNNPITRVYSKKQIQRLLKNFRIESLRKNSFSFSQLPLAGRIRTPLLKWLCYKPWESGIIVYGSPHYGETKVELSLSPILGFAWNIVASKN